MMTRRINLTLAASILAIITAGILGFAVTGSATANSPTTITDETAPATAEPTPPASTTQPGNDEDTATIAIDAAGIYATHCASCHGTTGQGGSGGPVDDLDLTLAEVIDITANGAPRMPSYNDTLTLEEIQAVSQYTLSLNKDD